MLQQPRQQIDQIDAQLVKLFEQRMQCVTEVARIKQQQQLPIFDAKREQDVIIRACSRVNDPQYQAAISDMFQALMRITKTYQAEWINQHT